MNFSGQEIDVLIDAPTLQARIRELGAQIARDYAGKELTLVGIMKGAIFFLTDLSRAIDLPLTIELIGVSSYHGGTESTGEVRITHDVSAPMNGKHLLVVEDIIDTGLTIQFLLGNLRARRPASLKVCSLIEKEQRNRSAANIDYKGFTIEDRFVVGYGLDYNEKYRNLPFIGTLRPE